MTAPTGSAEQAAGRSARNKGRLVDPNLLLGLLGVAALLTFSLFTGVFDITDPDFGREMFEITRIPRTIALVLAGAAMAMSGLVMQLLTQNRFVEPTTTGTTEWAGLGLILTMIMLPDAGIVPRMIGAVLSAFLGTMIFFLFLRRVKLSSSLIVPIVGIMLGAVVAAIATGVVTVVVGNLPFLGLIVPSIVSLFRGDDLRSNLPWVCLLGIAIVTVCELIGRTIIMPFEVPVSLILGVVGAAVFISLLLRSRRHG